MNRTQHEALLEAMKMDKKNLVKYQQIYKYAYILSDGVFKIVFAEEKGLQIRSRTETAAIPRSVSSNRTDAALFFGSGPEGGLPEGDGLSAGDVLSLFTKRILPCGASGACRTAPGRAGR